MAEPVPLPRYFRPLGARIATALAGAILVAAVAFLWLMLPSRVQATFGIFQRLTLLAVFASMLAVLYGVFRTSAFADDAGLTVTNGFRVHRYEWAELVRLSLSRNRPWALLDLADGTTMPVMAIQTADGENARLAARELANLIRLRSEPA